MSNKQVLSSDTKKLIDFIHQKKLEAPAVFLLESLYPMRGLMNHLSDFVDPIGKLMAPSWSSTLKDILSSEESYQEIIENCEVRDSNKVS